MKKKCPKSGEVYAYYIEELEKYGACQIVKIENKSVYYVSLDCLTDYLPEREEISGWKPLYLEGYRNHHKMDAGLIDLTPLPPNYQCLGEFPLVTDKVSNSYSGSWPDGSQYISENRWKSFGEEVTATYKKYVNSGEDVIVYGKIFPKRLPVLGDELYSHLKEQDSLKQFPCILSAQVEGFSEKLTKLIKTSPLLTELVLKNPGVSVMDLRGTGLDSLKLDMTGVKRLYLPERVRELFLYGDADRELMIDDSACDEKLPPIFVWVSLKKVRINHFGMRKLRVKRLVIKDIVEIDATEIANYFPDLKDLYMAGTPGVIKNVQMLGRLENLQELRLEDLFGFGMELLEGIKRMPALWALHCESIPKDVGLEMKKQLRETLDVLTVAKLRDENWLKENTENPLCHWDGSEFVPSAAYKKAFQCYKKTRRQLLGAVNRQEVLYIVQTYTEQFNQLNEKYEEFIETEEREDIFAAMKQLYEDCISRRFAERGIGSENSMDITLEEVYTAMEEVRRDW